ncbi:hypothetical protein Tco_0100509, partial [Tanacetum coccineum]
MFIHQSSSYDQDKDAKEGDASESLSGLRFMPNYDLASISTQSDPLGHLHAELSLLNTKIDQLESSISEKVVEAMKSSVPAIVADTLKEQLPSLLFDALKDTLPQLINDSIKSSVLEFIAEELPQVEAQVQKNLQNQLPNILLKPMMKEVRHKLSACTSTVVTNSQHVQDLRVMFKDMVSLLEAAEVFKKANAERRRANTADIVQGEQPSAQVVPNEEKALVVHNPEEKKS